MTAKQKKSGRWQAGESGNPKGRPAGTGEIAKLRESINTHLPAIITKLVAKAKQGDMQAARLLLERVLPPVKSIEPTVALSLPIGGGVTAQAEAIIQAVTSGEIAPSQGASLLTGLGVMARLKEVDEFERRIAQLELSHAKAK